MKVLVVQGAGMALRGKVDVEIFGPETIEEINAGIEAAAASLGMTVDIIQHDDEGDLVAALTDSAADVDAIVINPSGFTVSDGSLPEVLAGLPVPVFEVHASNPAARGVVSRITPVSRGAVCGFGYDGYRIALEGIRQMLT
jgi:3-dehydroquinate dehydratase